MRITSQMLNESARKSGLTFNRHSLLDYVNGGNNFAPSAQTVLPPKKTETAHTINKTKYEKQEKVADELDIQARKFVMEGSENLFEQAKASSDTAELQKEAEALVEKYNNLLSNMKETSGVMEEFYKYSLKELVSENKDALAELGISAGKDGKLQVDSDKLKAASCETLEKVLGAEGTFIPKLSFLSSRVADNANANLVSVYSNYLSNGNRAENYMSKYNFWG